MAPKTIRSIFTVSFLFILFSTFIPTTNVHALTRHFRLAGLPLLDEFVSQVRNGHADELRGVYIPEILAARVVQQPVGKDDYVSPRQNIMTQFHPASHLGSTGLLAHNHLAGKPLSLLPEERICSG